VPAHCPFALHLSTSVQESPSSQAVPVATGGWLQSEPLQTSLVHSLLSAVQGEPLRGVCAHAPFEQTSVVHSFPSLEQAMPLRGGCVHDPLEQTSFVHTLPSSLHALPEDGGCVQAPLEHRSSVQMLLSSGHAFPLSGLCVQTPMGGKMTSHTSCVHTLLSLQSLLLGL
jgi:hypothetical protein